MPDGSPEICSYEGSDYQASFWEKGGRAYEDGAEAIALRRLLPATGSLLLEIGAGAGRNTPRYHNFERIVLLDYSLTQLQQAQARLGRTQRYTYVAADVYHLPFVAGLFDAVTMIRVLHHISDASLALQQIRRVSQAESVFILEYANKLNLKAILRYWLRRQSWSPFTLEPVEFARLNFDFHPQAIRSALQQNGFRLERQLTVSHFRINLLKRLFPVRLLVWGDSLAQWTGALWQLTPSVFTRSRAVGATPRAPEGSMFCCPQCGSLALSASLKCEDCARQWVVQDGIYDFRL